MKRLILVVYIINLSKAYKMSQHRAIWKQIVMGSDVGSTHIYHCGLRQVLEMGPLRSYSLLL